MHCYNWKCCTENLPELIMLTCVSVLKVCIFHTDTLHSQLILINSYATVCIISLIVAKFFSRGEFLFEYYVSKRKYCVTTEIFSIVCLTSMCCMCKLAVVVMISQSGSAFM